MSHNLISGQGSSVPLLKFQITRRLKSLAADSHIPCRSPATTLPFSATTLPFSDSAERGQVAHLPSLDGIC
jgi:hypothetical protein